MDERQVPSEERDNFGSQPYDSAQDDAGAEHDDAMHEPHSLLSGKLVTGIVVGLAVFLAAAAWLYRYDQKRLAREFWGFESPRIFRDAASVTAVLIRPEDTGREAMPAYYDNLYVVGPMRYEQIKKFEVAKKEEPKKTDPAKPEETQPAEPKPVDPKLASLRAQLDFFRTALGDYHSYDSGTKTWQQPEWRYGLIFVDGNYTASIVFDAECKIGRPQSIEKQISTVPISDKLLAFFQEIFPEAKDMKSSASKNIFAQPLIETPKPEATSTGTGGAVQAAGNVNLTPTADADVLTTRNSTTTGAVPTATPTTGTSASTLTLGVPALSNPGGATLPTSVPSGPTGTPSPTIPPGAATSTGQRIVGPALPNDLTSPPVTTTTGKPTATTTTAGK